MMAARVQLEILPSLGIQDLEIEGGRPVGGSEVLQGRCGVIAEVIEGNLNGDALDEGILDLVEEVYLSDDGVYAVGVKASWLHVCRDEQSVALVHIAAPLGPVLSPQRQLIAAGEVLKRYDAKGLTTLAYTTADACNDTAEGDILTHEGVLVL